MLKRFPRKDDAGKPSPVQISGDVGINPNVYSLYFKGLVRDDGSLARFGVAICGKKGDLLFHLKGPIHVSNVTVLEAELTALKRGLTQAVSLGITHISIYCDYHPIYELVTGRCVPEEKKIALLMNNVQRIRKRFTSRIPIFVTKNGIRYAYKLAKEIPVSKIITHMVPLSPRPVKATCNICLDVDINANQMFYVDKCGHRFCNECVKLHLEVRILEESVMIRCPHYNCKSKLTWGSCINLLTRKLRKMWLHRLKEDSIPVTERIYCPNPRCSDLMPLVNELSK